MMRALPPRGVRGGLLGLPTLRSMTLGSYARLGGA